MTRPTIISCLFGSGEFNIYPPPLQENCFFFTNRREIADLAQLRGWDPVMMPIPEETDPLVLSLQSKAVKFLAFLNDPYYREIHGHIENSVLYFDHKFRVEEQHIGRIVTAAGDAEILLRSTPKLKTSVWEEVKASIKQERYARHMDETLRYIETTLKNGFSAETRICNTGLIYYAHPQAALPLTYKVFSACMMLKQPECQIFWALHSQEHKDKIMVIDWNDPAVSDILWKDPRPRPSLSQGKYSTAQRFRSRLRRWIR